MIERQVSGGYGSHARIPLTEDQFADVGRIVTLFGFLERCLDIMLSHMMRTQNWPIFYKIFDGRLLGSKCDILKELVKLHEKDSNQAQLLEYCAELAALISRRNHVVHGEWGIVGPARIGPPVEPEVELKEEELSAGSHYAKNPDNPFRADQLKGFCEELDRFMGKTLDLMGLLNWLPGGMVGRPLVLMNARGHSSRRQ